MLRENCSNVFAAGRASSGGPEELLVSTNHGLSAKGKGHLVQRGAGKALSGWQELPSELFSPGPFRFNSHQVHCFSGSILRLPGRAGAGLAQREVPMLQGAACTHPCSSRRRPGMGGSGAAGCWDWPRHPSTISARRGAIPRLINPPCQGLGGQRLTASPASPEKIKPT